MTTEPRRSKNKTKTFGISFPDLSIFEKGTARADELDISFSNYVNRLIEQDIQRKAQGSILSPSAKLQPVMITFRPTISMRTILEDARNMFDLNYSQVLRSSLRNTVSSAMPFAYTIEEELCDKLPMTALIEEDLRDSLIAYALSNKTTASKVLRQSLLNYFNSKLVHFTE